MEYIIGASVLILGYQWYTQKEEASVINAVGNNQLKANASTDMMENRRTGLRTVQDKDMLYFNVQNRQLNQTVAGLIIPEDPMQNSREFKNVSYRPRQLI